MKAIVKYAPFFFFAVFAFVYCKKENIPAINNKPPVANAGNDQTIAPPITGFTLNGIASADPDGSIISYLWTQVSGPSKTEIIDSNKVQTSVNGFVEGVYKFHLQVTDNAGATDDETVVITVNPVTAVLPLPPTIFAQLTWISNLSQWRIATTAATAGTKVLFAGGASVNWDGDVTDVFSRVDIYDYNTKKWSMAELSLPRYRTASASAGNKILFAGGVTAAGNATTRVDIYDVAANSWSTAELKQASFGISAISSGNKILFAAGGKAGSSGNNPERSNLVDIYDASMNTWTTATLSEARAEITGAAVGTKILFAGGWNGNEESDRVDIYDVSTNIWSTASLSQKKTITAAISVGNKILFARSFDGGNPGISSYYSKQVDIYDASTGEWSIDSLNNFNLPSNSLNNSLGAATAGNFAAFFISGAPYFIIYNSLTNTWGISPGINPLFGWDTAVVGANDQIYIAGWEGVWKVQF